MYRTSSDGGSAGVPGCGHSARRHPAEQTGSTRGRANATRRSHGRRRESCWADRPPEESHTTGRPFEQALRHALAMRQEIVAQGLGNTKAGTAITARLERELVDVHEVELKRREDPLPATNPPPRCGSPYTSRQTGRDSPAHRLRCQTRANVRQLIREGAATGDV